MLKIALFFLSCFLGEGGVFALVFLSDLVTPSFLIDVQSIQRVACSNGDSPIPPILLPSSNQQIVAHSFEKYSHQGHPQHTFDTTLHPIDILGAAEGGDVCYGYMHCRVTKPRQPDDSTTFLAALDVPAAAAVGAHLVLGLNNHHVVSYYWARSAGAGAAMEAPGVVLSNGGNTLQWESEAGFTDCNSNDGKRSEWVNFLRTGDQVQLRPACTETALLQPAWRHKIYGISTAGRPLGSEPVVVCQWRVEGL